MMQNICESKYDFFTKNRVKISLCRLPTLVFYLFLSLFHTQALKIFLYPSLFLSICLFISIDHFFNNVTLLLFCSFLCKPSSLFLCIIVPMVMPNVFFLLPFVYLVVSLLCIIVPMVMASVSVHLPICCCETFLSLCLSILASVSCIFVYLSFYICCSF